MEAGDQPSYMTTDEVANEFRTKPGSVRYWRHVGYGPESIRIGRRVLYRREDVDAWIENERAEQNGQPAA